MRLKRKHQKGFNASRLKNSQVLPAPKSTQKTENSTG